MPELPDIEAYRHALKPLIVGQPITRIRIIGPSVLRTFDPPAEAVENKTVIDILRLGKRIVLSLDDDLFLIFHLMIAGRFRWLGPKAKPIAKIALATLDFPVGTLVLTEAGTKKRATLHIVKGAVALAAHDPRGTEPLTISLTNFTALLRRENHTIKRSLTDPHLLAGIGNAYSDEILHAAGLSPIAMTQKLTDDEISRLHAAMQRTLAHWTNVLRRQFEKKFPGAGDVTAFRKDFAVHGRFGLPCPVCGTKVQRIRYASNETNYCPRCQTDGRILADRSLSRLLKSDWPRHIDEVE